MMNLIKMLWHYILIFVLMIERLLRGTKIKIADKEQMNIVRGVKGPIIFAPTHCGKFDIQTLAEVLWQYRWSLLSGDPNFLPGTVEGYWLKFHGVIYVDRDDRMANKGGTRNDNSPAQRRKHNDVPRRHLEFIPQFANTAIVSRDC